MRSQGGRRTPDSRWGGPKGLNMIAMYCVKFSRKKIIT